MEIVTSTIWNSFDIFDPGDLDLWPSDPKFDTVPLLPRTDVWTKFVSYWSETKRLQTDIPTDMCKAICPLFFEVAHNKQNKHEDKNVMTSLCYAMFRADDVIQNIILHTANIKISVRVIILDWKQECCHVTLKLLELNSSKDSSYLGNILARATISSTLVLPALWSPTTTTYINKQKWNTW